MREGGKKWQKHPKSMMGRPSTTPAQHRAPSAMRVKELGSPLISRWEIDDPNTRLTEMGHNSEQWAAPTNRTHVTCHEPPSPGEDGLSDRRAFLRQSPCSARETRAQNIIHAGYRFPLFRNSLQSAGNFIIDTE